MVNYIYVYCWSHYQVECLKLEKLIQNSQQFDTQLLSYLCEQF